MTGDNSFNPENLEFLCYVDGSWKETDNFSGLGWTCIGASGVETLVGARNLRRSLSFLHSELEALIWAMHCLLANQKTEVTFATDSTELIKMLASPTEWSAFATHLEEFSRSKASFTRFTLSSIPRSLNTKADKLVQSVSTLQYDTIYVNYVLPVWISEPI